MSELLLSILRIGFLIALWWFVLTVVSVLRRDLQAPRDAKPLTPARSHWIVEDLGSTNGTWIDRTRVSTPTVFRPGTQLRIGRTSMELSS